MPVFYLLIAFALSVFSSATAADQSQFRLGVGAYGMKLKYSVDGLPDNDFGSSLFAEYSENNYSGSRLVVYSIKDDDKDIAAHGAEVQLLLGYGLANNGFRIYTGPTWHIEHMHLPRADDSSISHTFKGWAWQIGTGVQYKRFAIDYAFGLRNNQSYKHESRQAGNPGGGMYTQNILLGYRF